MDEHSPTPTREETLRKKHHEILMQVAYALKDLETQPEKRVYITQKMKHLRKMFCELIPPHEIRKRGNRTLTKAKISIMQEARKINAEKRKIEFEQLMSQFRLKNMSLSVIFDIETSSKQSIRNFIGGRAIPTERFLGRFRSLVKNS